MSSWAKKLRVKKWQKMTECDARWVVFEKAITLPSHSADYRSVYSTLIIANRLYLFKLIS